MPFDPDYAAAVLERVSREPQVHTVILGAGANTLDALSRASDAARRAVRAVLDDNPALHGRAITSVPIALPQDYPISLVDRVLITSETHFAPLRRRARAIFEPRVEIKPTFAADDSLAAAVADIEDRLDQAGRDQPHDAAWLSLDRLHQRIGSMLADDEHWRYGPERQWREFEQCHSLASAFAIRAHPRVLNLGCGVYHPLGQSILWLLHGASHAVAIDPQPLLDEARSARATLDLVKSLLTRPLTLCRPGCRSRAGAIECIDSLLDMVRLSQGQLKAAVQSPHLTILQAQIQQAGVASSSVDLVFSRDVLEHIADIPAALAAVHRILSPKGLFIAAIDFADHRVYQDCIRFTPWSHLTDAGQPSYLGTNRIWFRQYEPLFKKAGFELLAFNADASSPVPADIRGQLPQPYCQMTDEELSVIRATAVLRRA